MAKGRNIVTFGLAILAVTYPSHISTEAVVRPKQPNTSAVSQLEELCRTAEENSFCEGDSYKKVISLPGKVTFEIDPKLSEEKKFGTFKPIANREQFEGILSFPGPLNQVNDAVADHELRHWYMFYRVWKYRHGNNETRLPEWKYKLYSLRDDDLKAGKNIGMEFEAYYEHALFEHRRNKKLWPSILDKIADYYSRIARTDLYKENERVRDFVEARRAKIESITGKPLIN